MAVNNTLSTFEYYVAEHTDNGISRIPERVAQDAVLQLERAGRQKSGFDAMLAALESIRDMPVMNALEVYEIARAAIAKATS